MQKRESINIFIAYSRRDREYLDKLRIALKPLELSNTYLKVYDDGEIMPGNEWNSVLKSFIMEADIIILLISADSLASDYFYDNEITYALKRHEKEAAIVIPIILRYCAWQTTGLSQLQVLPRGGKPITAWDDMDAAYFDIVRGIRSSIKTIESRRITFERKQEPRVEIQNIYRLEDVFTTNGQPDVTFVEHPKYKYIKLAVLQKGRGIVVEGPSGIGKTTTIIGLLNNSKKPYVLLSARSKDDIEKIKTINDWHSGIVVIDDFHRLYIDIQNNIVDYLKYLADYSKNNNKLIIIGIPNTGSNLISLSFDIANRISICKLGVVDDKTVEKLIVKGEDALNIKFIEKENIIRESLGSLFIAQSLCACMAMIDDVEATQNIEIKVDVSVYDVINHIKQDLAPKYDNLVRQFAAIGGKKDKTCLEILRKIALEEEGILNLNYLRADEPTLRLGIDRILANREIEQFYLDNQDCQRHLLFDSNIPALIIDDPQFKFYLNHTSIDRIAMMTGKVNTSGRTKVFISYSHRDDMWKDEVLLHLKHLEREGIIDLWVDEKIKAGQRWRQEINDALSQAKVAILLVSQNFLASDFIVDNELPPILEANEKEDAIILQLILKPCSFNDFPELSKFQAVNDPKLPLAGMNEVDKAQTLVNLASLVKGYLQE